MKARLATTMLLAAALLTGCSSQEEKSLAQVRRDQREGNYAAVYVKAREVIDAPSGYSEAARAEAQKVYEEAARRLTSSYVSTILLKIAQREYAEAASLYHQSVAEVPEISTSDDLNLRLVGTFASLEDWTEARAAALRLADSRNTEVQSEGRRLLDRLDEYERVASEVESLRDRVEAIGSAVDAPFNEKQDLPDCRMGPAIAAVPEDQRGDVERFFQLIAERNSIAGELMAVASGSEPVSS